jgi:hypothetical protein
MPFAIKSCKAVKRHSYRPQVYRHVFGQTGRRAHIPTARKAAGRETPSHKGNINQTSTNGQVAENRQWLL